MTCSIDGTSTKSYTVYRVKSNFETVMKNIQRINELKKKYRLKYPLLIWQFIVFGHIEHEIPLARDLARRNHMQFHPKLSWDTTFSPIRNSEIVKEQLGGVPAIREEFKELHGNDYKQNICHQLWDHPQINWDGKILGCGRNFGGDFEGHAFTDGLANSLNNEKVHYAREMFLGKQAARDDIPCTTCEIYLTMKTHQGWLKRGHSWTADPSGSNVTSDWVFQCVPQPCAKDFDLAFSARGSVIGF